jgi:hypothetical protein
MALVCTAHCKVLAVAAAAAAAGTAPQLSHGGFVFAVKVVVSPQHCGATALRNSRCAGVSKCVYTHSKAAGVCGLHCVRAYVD